MTTSDCATSASVRCRRKGKASARAASRAASAAAIRSLSLAFGGGSCFLALIAPGAAKVSPDPTVRLGETCERSSCSGPSSSGTVAGSTESSEGTASPSTASVSRGSDEREGVRISDGSASAVERSLASSADWVAFSITPEDEASSPIAPSSMLRICMKALSSSLCASANARQ